MIQKILKILLCLVMMGVFGLLGYNFNSLNKQNNNQQKYIQKLEEQQFKTNLEILILSQKQEDILIETKDAFNSIYRSFDNVLKGINILNDTNEILIKRTSDENIQKQIKKDKFNQFVLEKKLQIVNVYIENTWIDKKTKEKTGRLGSGVTLKYNNKFYILTAAHLIYEGHKNFMLKENNQEICKLKVVSIDVKNDLMLLVPEDENIKFHLYTELADYEPLTAQEVYVVGNPSGLEDSLSEGRVIKYNDKYMVVQDLNTFFGNSGGGVYNKKGELVGIVSTAWTFLAPNSMFPPMVIDFEIRLQIIREFLKKATNPRFMFKFMLENQIYYE